MMRTALRIPKLFTSQRQINGGTDDGEVDTGTGLDNTQDDNTGAQDIEMG